MGKILTHSVCRNMLLLANLFFININMSGQVIQTVKLKFMGGDLTGACRFDQLPASILDVVFTVSTTFPAGTTFYLELSNENGVFATTPTTYDSTTSTPANIGTLHFLMPTTLVGGDNYLFRVRAIQGATLLSLVESASNYFLYYKIFNGPFSINSDATTANFCGGGSFLSVDAFNKLYVPTLNPLLPPPFGTTPLDYPYLKYRWYQGSTIISGQTGSSIFIGNDSGFTTGLGTGSYYVVIEYGLGGCTSTAASTVAITYDTSAGSTIISTLGTYIKSGFPTDLKTTTVVTGETYQWYKDNVAISGATTYIYNTDVPGKYKVLVKNATCSGFTNEIELIRGENPNPNPGDIPNLVSPNGDGKNDIWDIPLDAYGIGTNTTVTIISSQGEIVLKTDHYANDWPLPSIEFGAVNPVYYYSIAKQGQDEKKGSITLMK